MDKPLLSNSVIITAANDKTAVFNSKTKKSYVFGKETSRILMCMDGKHTIAELRKVNEVYTEEQIVRLVEQLDNLDFLASNKKKKYRFRKGKFRLGAINGNKLFKTRNILTQLLFYLIAFLSIPLLVLGIYLFYKTGNIQVVFLLELLHMPVLLHIISFLLIATIHEFAHAVVARYYNVPVPEIGVMLFFILPYVYTDLSFIRLLENKAKRIMCLLGGIVTRCIMSSGSRSFYYLMRI